MERSYVTAFRNVIAAVSNVEAYVTPALAAQVEALEAGIPKARCEELREIARTT